MKKSILCYGDSNTWGYIPGVGRRFPEDIRWTGVLQDLLGSTYEVIENGLVGRTTVFDDPYGPCRNGLASLDCALLSSAPLDLVSLALGTNDLKFTDAFGSRRGAGRLLHEILFANERLATDAPIFPNGAKVLLLSPIRVHPDVFQINPETNFRGAPLKSEEFTAQFSALPRQFPNVWFLDSAMYAGPSSGDGIHMDPDSHQKLGHAIYEQVKLIL